MDKQTKPQWNSVNPRRLTKIIAVILLCIIVPIVTLFGMWYGFIFLFIALMFGSVELPVIGFYMVLIALVLAFTYAFSKGLPRSKRFIRLFGVLVFSVLLAVLTSGFAQDIYKKYEIFVATPKMEKFLEDRYNEDFVIINPDSCKETKWGPEPYVCADAYSKDDPTYIFSIRETSSGEYYEDFKEFKEK